MRHCFFAMFERYIQAVRTDDSGPEEPAATRERLRAAFAPGATRRMTQLGLLVGATLGPLEPAEDDAIVYASSYGESRALEAFLESFPFPSPTLFQTSIHPSGVQQGLIGRQRTLHPSQHRADTRNQFARRKRFGDVVVRPQLEADDAINLS